MLFANFDPLLRIARLKLGVVKYSEVEMTLGFGFVINEFSVDGIVDTFVAQKGLNINKENAKVLNIS